MSKLVNTSKEQIVIQTKSPISDYFYNDFLKVLKAYLKELKSVNIDNAKMSSSDFSVLNDIIQEANEYTLLLFRSNHVNQSLELNELVHKVVSIFMVVFKNLFMDQDYNNTEIELNPNQLLKFPYLLKLTYLETKLQLLIGLCIKQTPVSEQTTDECIGILNEISTIQSNLNIPKYYIGCSLFYRASLCFILGNVTESLLYAKEALSLIEDRAIESIIEDTTTPEFDEKFTIKISSVIDFIGNLHEYLKE